MDEKETLREIGNLITKALTKMDELADFPDTRINELDENLGTALFWVGEIRNDL